MESNNQLDGYRSRERTQEELLQDQTSALHMLSDEGIDPELVREVIRSDQLVAAMQTDKVLGRLVTYVTTRLDECSKAWSSLKNPRDDEAMTLHTEARACRVLIDWIEFVLTSGAQATKQLEAEEEYEQET